MTIAVAKGHQERKVALVGPGKGAWLLMATVSGKGWSSWHPDGVLGKILVARQGAQTMSSSVAGLAA